MLSSSIPIAFGTSVLAETAKEDFWISIITSYVLCALVFYGVSSINKLSWRLPGFVTSLGKWLYVLVLFGLVAANLVMIVIIKVVYLKQTPPTVIMLSLCLVFFWGMTRRPQAPWYLAEISMWVLILASVSLIVLVGPDTDLQRIRPILAHGVSPVIKGSLFILPLMLNCIVLATFNTQGQYTKSFYTGLLIGFFGFFSTCFLSVIDLSVQLTQKLPLATYIIILYIEYWDFFTGVETFYNAAWILYQATSNLIMLSMITNEIPDKRWFRGKLKSGVLIGLLFLATFVSRRYYYNLIEVMSTKWSLVAAMVLLSTCLVMIGRRDKEGS